ncbi:GNAT family N-acetyltransferase [Falsibacillus albus]|uniref:GNAT family N-acetyltransferase n=1 Tax=Falsibacillus albus TaxID=2478915 RepID=A0A3L7JTW1_9BACI|nr:GNAT family N-acetyltransferase [Falsibacillus albus]RLQ94268.1 GNAT family N-acetyltransferase [Falsibacillus albus]
MIELKPMTSYEFEKYIKAVIKDYAEEKVAAGNWKAEEAMKKSEEDFHSLLPQEEKTENNHLFTIVNDNSNVGMIWLARRQDDSGFIYDILISEDQQGKGFGKAAMYAIEGVAKELGMNKIHLHVFGHNKIARSLYEKIGYETTNIKMEKKL